MFHLNTDSVQDTNFKTLQPYLIKTLYSLASIKKKKKIGVVCGKTRNSGAYFII